MIRAGAAGLNLEDPVDTEPPGRVGSFGKGDASELVEPEEQAERIRAAVEVGRVAGGPLVVNARTDVYWREIGDPEERFAERFGEVGRTWMPAPNASSCLASRTRTLSQPSSGRYRAP